MTNFLLGGLLVFAMATALEGYLLFNRAQLLLNHAENLQRMAAKDRHPAGSRTVAPEPEIATGSPVDVNSAVENERPQQEPETEPAAAVIADDWEQQRDAMVADMLAEIRGVK